MGRCLPFLFLVATPLAAQAVGEGPSPIQAPRCNGDYADFLYSLRPETRSFEASSKAEYTYCIRTIATYEHISYGRGGVIRKQYLRHVRHGTGFAYAHKGAEWLIATNQHVAEHPEITESDSDVEGVPAGSRKVREVIRIVKSEADEDEPDQIPLTRVVSDAALDVSVLQTRHPLKLMPYRFGRSAAVKVGNAVQVRGYPLGAFAASNTGKVIGVGQMDRERGWDHEDFVVDALLNSGNSGSPVLAVSCRTGELELVGIYHAGYRDAQALNVVISIDQVRDLLQNLRARPQPPAARAAAPDRAATLAALQRAHSPFVMPFGDRVVQVAAEGQAVRFSVLGAGYPLSTAVQMAVLDRAGSPAAPSALLLPARFGSREIPWPALDPAMREQADQLRSSLWVQLAAVLSYREAEASGRALPEARGVLAEVAAAVNERRTDQRELLATVEFVSDDMSWPSKQSEGAKPVAIDGAPDGSRGGSARRSP